MTSPRRRTVLVLLSAVLLPLGSTAYANVTLTGNVDGNPKVVPKDPCPRHGAKCTCLSRLSPGKVTKIATPSNWFQNKIQADYPAADNWNFHFVGGNANLNGKFDVKFYRAYNDCPGSMGAEIEVEFQPDAGSLIDDVIWSQALEWDFRCYKETKMDDLSFLKELGNYTAGDKVMGGPFYPFQDEDEDGWTPPHPQTNYQYDKFYDKPGRGCPDCGTKKYAKFETYAIWWDDYFKADGTIEDVSNDGHHVFVHEGFSWGVQLKCVPKAAPAKTVSIPAFSRDGIAYESVPRKLILRDEILVGTGVPGDPLAGMTISLQGDYDLMESTLGEETIQFTIFSDDYLTIHDESGTEVYLRGDMPLLTYLPSENMFYGTLIDVGLAGVDVSSPFHDPELTPIASPFLLDLDRVLNPESPDYDPLARFYFTFTPEEDFWEATGGFMATAAMDGNGMLVAAQMIPEPASIVLLALGGLGLLPCWRRRVARTARLSGS